MNKVEVIAEIGKNFVDTEEEQPESELLVKAKKLIQAAKASGADTAKFQVHNVDDEIHPDAKIISPHFDQDRYKWVKRNTYSVDFWHNIRDFCRQVNIDFLATPMSRGAAQILDEVGVDRWKIGSGDILDFVLLDYVRDSGKPVIMSSGMSSIEEVRLAYEYLREKTEDVTILHCVSIYPCPNDKLNLGTIPYLKKQFPEATIGFSDHSGNGFAGEFAVRLGAEVVEKHFTFGMGLWGPDHKSSSLPDVFAGYVRRIRKGTGVDIPSDVLGDETKYLQHEEEGFRPIFQKGLFASRDIKKGEIFEPDMILAMRPKQGGARRAVAYVDVLGATTNVPIKKHEII